MTQSATAALNRYGIAIDFEPSGAVQLIGRNGVSCTYSARGACPVVGMGAPEGAVSVWLRRDGIAGLMIDGRPYEYRPNDPACNLGIPTE
jgi:hypothetical protein